MSSRVPVVSLEFNTVSYGDKLVQLSPTEAEFVYVVIEAAPLPVTFEVLLDRIWPRRFMLRKLIHTYAAIVNHKLRGLGFRLRNVWAVGYRLEYTG